MKTSMPSRLRSKADRSKFNRVVTDLARHGLDAESRVELICDYVEIDQRIADLRKDAKGGSIATRLAASRALNVSTAERRRLHQRLFAGGKRVEDNPPPVADVVAAVEPDDGAEAWRAYWHNGPRLGLNDGTPGYKAREAAWKARGDELRARYGDCPLKSLLYRTREEEIGICRLLEEYRPKVIPDSALSALYAEIGLDPPGPRRQKEPA